MSAEKRFGVAIIGCGTVGGATAARLMADRELHATRTGIDFALRYIVDIDFTHARALGLDEGLYETDMVKALNDPEVDLVVELIGGTTLARDVTERALRAGKYVVTANKALLAECGSELMALARENGVCMGFEASCAGGIPIIRALVDGLLANRLDALYGIVNGTCNYILTEMIEKGQSYDDALREAQAAGLAEADPYLDVSGHDSAHKLAIMGSLAFGRKVDLAQIPVEGIDSLDTVDVQYGSQLGYVVKLLAVAQALEDGISLRVRPAFIGRDHPLAWVSGPFNAVSVYGDAVGHTMYYGRGAGGSPTASAVVSDILAIGLGTLPALFTGLRLWPDCCEPAVQHPVERIRSRYYVRVTVLDRPGVLASLAAIFSENGISISSVLQRELPEDGSENLGQIVITTHLALENDVRTALARVDALATVQGSSVCINIIDEHEEDLPG